jgi:hypothetical protein
MSIKRVDNKNMIITDNFIRERDYQTGEFIELIGKDIPNVISTSSYFSTPVSKRLNVINDKVYINKKDLESYPSVLEELKDKYIDDGTNYIFNLNVFSEYIFNKNFQHLSVKEFGNN